MNLSILHKLDHKMLCSQLTKIGKSLKKDEISDKNLLFGTGLCSLRGGPGSLSIPFDIMVYFILGPWIVKSLGLSKIIYWVGDQEALKANPNFTLKEIEQINTLAQMHKKLFISFAKNLHISNYEVFLSSEISQDPLYQEIEKKTKKTSEIYELVEAISIEFFRIKHKAVIKLSWSDPKTTIFEKKIPWEINYEIEKEVKKELASSIKNEKLFEKNEISNKTIVYNEEYFDVYYCKIFDNDELSFVYCKPGKEKPDKKKCPYVCLEHEKDNRLLIGDDLETIQKKLSSGKKSLKFQKRYLTFIKSFKSFFPNILEDFKKIKKVNEKKQEKNQRKFEALAKNIHQLSSLFV